MNHIKLFEEIEIDREDFPWDGHELSPREKKILMDLVEEVYLNRFVIKVEDHYYYCYYTDKYNTDIYYNRFDDFNDLKDYVLSRYYMYFMFSRDNNIEKFLKILKNSKLDPSFDDNISIKWASIRGHKEIVKLLLSDTRVRSKLTEEEIYYFYSK